MRVTSAAGVIALLDEPDQDVKFFALRKLDEIVDLFWHEISEVVTKIEMLYEDEMFKNRTLAALIVSKVYYHLGAFEDSVTFALHAGNMFDVNGTTEYVETIVSKCIDQYVKLSVKNSETAGATHEETVIDQNLTSVVDRMFKRCLDDGQFKQAVGISLETRRMDIFEKAILQSDDIPGMLSYSFRVCLSLVQNRQFRSTVLTKLVELYKKLAQADYISVCQCLIFLDEPQSVATILESLIKKNEDSALMAYQIGFDLYESATQQFLQSVQAALRQTAPAPILPVTTVTPTVVQPETSPSEESAMDVDDKSAVTSPVPTPVTPAAVVVDAAPAPVLSEADAIIQKRVIKLHDILGGDITIGLHLQFLIRSNKTDILVLKNTKDGVRNSVCHNATVMSNAFMHSGTTSDQFLRDNLEWLARATNWAKFTATASLGVIHKGHEKEALHLMSTYLPKDSGPGSAYSEGGGLYALGLIHANHGGEITEYILTQLKDATTDIVRHGACLGIGLAAMGTARQDVYEQLKVHLYQDDAITGEAAGIGIGLVMLGTKSDQAITDMVSYAAETQHEKILRGLAVGISLTMFGRMEESDTLVEQLSRDKDPILRWSAMYTVAMAYCGTGNNGAIQRLLHAAVSDVNDDVRRAAVTSLGFLLFRMPEQCASVLALLSESYNPHVRYGAAMALGIACAGTGLKDAIALLEPMINDPVNYVRQGALIASALVLIQQNESTCPKMVQFRTLYAKVIADKHEDVMAKFGAILAQGIIDAGGRNTTITLQSRTGHTNMTAVVGLLVFVQFWYWYPLTHFLSLAFTPTSVIGLNADLNMPRINFKSNARPSIFAYVPPLEDKKDKVKEKVETAVLSITAKQQKRKDQAVATAAAGGSGGKKKDDKMEVDEEKKEEKEMEVEKKEEKKEDKTAAAAAAEAAAAVGVKTGEKKDDAAADLAKEEEKKKEVEPTFELLPNPVRVMRAQLKVMSMPIGSKYIPLKDISVGGIVMLKNARPTETEEIIELVAAGGPKGDDEAEPEPPEPFEWNDD